uniref:HeH/LEM domain-containing protein n=1 Tax=viral metagenome TaxID=1070528 RepID=A0A6C0K9W4_9ZZZZ
MVEFIHGIVALLAGVILVLSATVAWLYVQQSRIMHAINALAVAVTAPPPSFMFASPPPPEAEAPVELSAEPAAEAPAEPSAEPSAEDLVEKPEHEDDRISVHDVDASPADAPPSDAIESVQGKTVAQLRDILTAKGIPFNKSDKKPVLISLVQISS